MSEPWLTKRELAAALKVSTRTIERHIPPTQMVGGQNRYLMSAALRGEQERPADVVELRRVQLPTTTNGAAPRERPAPGTGEPAPMHQEPNNGGPRQSQDGRP